ncbi:hypothetical protein [Rhodopseudomonas palustris]|uniref:Uncharacterized protein n=1 Tax=Rhodopseudomonas palustris (strain ATCC BAA-98 / CGA009) TaxID=258594 RepID=A0AAE9XZV9_RHOPA|nr:hypothetical protein [Rhodopseudomonas palustris]WAB80243.1 hypothetical protein OR798_10940 [Rhodopseudomonas palustris]WCL92272.1 hypothetical protein TX73_010935 [Rhodopseudomonas palustris CGA009]WND54136.1 hypothetical protein L1A21_10895 [Rhodopseudomonas palustris]
MTTVPMMAAVPAMHRCSDPIALLYFSHSHRPRSTIKRAATPAARRTVSRRMRVRKLASPTIRSHSLFANRGWRALQNAGSWLAQRKAQFSLAFRDVTMQRGASSSADRAVYSNYKTHFRITAYNQSLTSRSATTPEAE